MASVAQFGGNWNNRTNVGAFYTNLNNSATNTNTNIGAAHSCQKSSSVMPPVFLSSRRKSSRPKRRGLVTAQAATVLEAIRRE